MEVFNFKTLQRLTLFKSHESKILSLDICKNAGKIVSLTYWKLKVWSLSTFILIKLIELQYPSNFIKIVEEHAYLGGADPATQILDLKKLELQCKAQNKSYRVRCISISVTHGLFAYGSC